MGKAWKIQFTCLPTTDPLKRIQPSACAETAHWRRSSCRRGDPARQLASFFQGRSFLAQRDQGRDNGAFFGRTDCSICLRVANSSFFLRSEPGLDRVVARKTRAMEEPKGRQKLPYPRLSSSIRGHSFGGRLGRSLPPINQAEQNEKAVLGPSRSWHARLRRSPSSRGGRRGT